METLQKILDKIKGIANIVIYIAVLFLLVVIYFKNNKIDNLQTELLKKPTIEKVYLPSTTDTITETVIKPVEVIKLDTIQIAKLDTVYQPIDLTVVDSASIAQAYSEVYADYSSKRLYDNVLKDDTLAFARLKETVQFNEITEREFIYRDKTPIIKETIYKVDKTFSVIGGIQGNFEGFSLMGGAVTNKNVVYTVGYNPFNKTATAGIYFPIFNF